MATVVIQRGNFKILGKKKVDVVLDGRRVVTVSNGETARFAVKGGTHKLNVTVDYFVGKKLLLEAVAGDTYYYTITPSKTYRFGVPYLIMLILVSAVPEKKMPFWIHMGIILAVGLPIIIWRAVIKDAYFNIREVINSD